MPPQIVGYLWEFSGIFGFNHTRVLFLFFTVVSEFCGVRFHPCPSLAAAPDFCWRFTVLLYFSECVKGESVFLLSSGDCTRKSAVFSQSEKCYATIKIEERDFISSF